MIQWLVFSDLDGSFLDHHDYSYEAALPAFSRLQSLNIPCIWNTSKTARELLEFRKTLNPDTPFVVENGAAVYLPAASALAKRAEKETGICELENESFRVKTFGPDYEILLNRLKDLQNVYKFQGFNQMSVDEVIACTGLAPADAARAKARGHTEPLLWQDDEERKKRFIEDAEGLGLRALQGGRFLTVGGHHDKGLALEWLRDLYQRDNSQDTHTIALGDGGNDIPMLQQADWAVSIPSASGKVIHIGDHQQLLVPANAGPKGWNTSIMKWLTQIGLATSEEE